MEKNETPDSLKIDLSHRAAFDARGELYTHMMAEKQDDVGRQARAYLYEKKLLRKAAAAKLRDAREAETHMLAKEANAIAERSAAAAEGSKKIAFISICIAACSLLVALGALLFSFRGS